MNEDRPVDTYKKVIRKLIAIIERINDESAMGVLMADESDTIHNAKELLIGEGWDV